MDGCLSSQQCLYNELIEAQNLGVETLGRAGYLAKKLLARLLGRGRGGRRYRYERGS